MTTPVATIDANGITVPAFENVLTYFQQSFQSIFGADIYIANDSQDGQLLSLFSTALNDTNAMAIAVYNQFSPATAQGVGLSSVVKTNGITRESPSNSQADVLLVGQVGTQIINGIVQDTIGNNLWSLPSSVTIPSAGQIVVTAVCQTAGQIAAPAGTITKMVTITKGWQSVNNALDATEGAPVETDSQLRQRQTKSVALPSRSVLEGIIGAVANVPGVTRYRGYENQTSLTDGNGQSPHSICIVVEGGDATQIAAVLNDKKGPGCQTFGTTLEITYDAYGIPHNIKFSRPVEVPITVIITITATNAYTSAIGAAAIAAVVAYGNGALIGDSVQAGELYSPASLGYPAATAPFKITSILLSSDGSPPSLTNIPIAFDHVASFATGRVSIVVS